MSHWDKNRRVKIQALCHSSPAQSVASFNCTDACPYSSEQSPGQHLCTCGWRALGPTWQLGDRNWSKDPGGLPGPTVETKDHVAGQLALQTLRHVSGSKQAERERREIPRGGDATSGPFSGCSQTLCQSSESRSDTPPLCPLSRLPSLASYICCQCCSGQRHPRKGHLEMRRGRHFGVVTMGAHWNLEGVWSRNAKNHARGKRALQHGTTIPPQKPLAPTLWNENHLQSKHTI